MVNISAGDDNKFLGDVQYDVAKHAVSRLGFAFNERLKKDGVVALTLLPGMTVTERVVHVTGTTDIPNSHSARFVGRCVVAIANASDVTELAGGAHKTGDIGRRYGLEDIDGTRPAPFFI